MPDEIPLIPKEEVIIPEKTYKTGRRSDKIIMLHRRITMPTDIKSIKKRIDSAQKLVQAASAELVEIKTLVPTITPTKKFPLEIDTIIIDIRKRLNKTQELIKNCDPKSIENMSEIDTLIDRHTDLEPVTGYHLLEIDSKKAKQDFINNCICKHKRK